MTFWIITLRIAGLLVFLWGFVGGTVQLVSSLAMMNFYGLFHSVTPLLESLAVSMLCFGVAAGLKIVERTDERIARATAARRARSISPSKNIAPDAPQPANTAKYADAAEDFRLGQNYRR